MKFMNAPIEIVSYMDALILEMTIDYYSHGLFYYYCHLILKWEKAGQQQQQQQQQKHKT